MIWFEHVSLIWINEQFLLASTDSQPDARSNVFAPSQIECGSTRERTTLKYCLSKTFQKHLWKFHQKPCCSCFTHTQKRKCEHSGRKRFRHKILFAEKYHPLNSTSTSRRLFLSNIHSFYFHFLTFIFGFRFFACFLFFLRCALFYHTWPDYDVSISFLYSHPISGSWISLFHPSAKKLSFFIYLTSDKYIKSYGIEDNTLLKR